MASTPHKHVVPPAGSAPTSAGRRGFLLLEVLPELAIVGTIVLVMAVVLGAVFGEQPARTDEAATAGEAPPPRAVPDSIYDMALLPAGGVAVTSFRNSISHHSAAGGEEWSIERSDGDQGVLALCERRLVQGLGTGVVLFRDRLDRNAENRVLGQHSHSVWRVAVSGNGRYAASSALDGETRLWDLEAGAELRDARIAGQNLPFRGFMALSHDGSLLAVVTAGNVIIRHIPSGKVLADLRQSERVSPHCVRFSPDGRYLAQGNEDGHILVWDLVTKQVVWKNDSLQTILLSVEFTQDGSKLFTGSMSGDIRVFDMKDGTFLDGFAAHESGVRVMRTTPDGRLYSAGYDGHVHRWNIEALSLEMTLR